MNNMNLEKLKKNLIYVIKESQTKLGYTYNDVTINYPADSLKKLLEADLSDNAMKTALASFAEFAKEELGEIKIARYEGQYTFTVSAETAAYIHDKVKVNSFLNSFVSLFHTEVPPSIEEILDVFRNYSDNVICKTAENEEFNYVVYFKDGVPDAFIYCIDLDEGHASYHRLTLDDYLAFGFEL